MKRCYWLTGLTHASYFSVNAGFIIGEGETLVVDTGNNAEGAALIAGYAQAVAPQNRLRYALNLEGHYDHTFGNGYFKALGCQLMAHPDVRLTEGELEAYLEQCNGELEISRRRKNREAYLYFEGVEPYEPDIPILKETHLDLPGVDVTIYPAPGHTPTNLLLYEAGEGVLYAADTVYSGFLPTMGFGDPPLWRSWLEALDRIEALGPKVLVPGHGKILFGEEIGPELDRHRKLLETRLSEEQP